MHAMHRVAMLAAAVSLSVSCTTHAPLPSGAIRVPTDDDLVSFGSQGIMCGFATDPGLPPTGVLEGDPSDSTWPVWLRAADGNRRYVVWPRDFSVRFDPDATLLDEKGVPILYAGSPATVASQTADPASGTRERPYAAGSFETGVSNLPHCYNRPAPFVADPRPLIAAVGVALLLTFGIAVVLLPRGPGKRESG
jgi:hypothetical protein